MEQRLAELENELTTMDKRKHEIVLLLQDEDTYADAARFRDLSQELEQIEKKAGQKTAAWEQMAEDLEAKFGNEAAAES